MFCTYKRQTIELLLILLLILGYCSEVVCKKQHVLIPNTDIVSELEPVLSVVPSLLGTMD